MNDFILEASQLTKEFQGFRAVNGVDLKIRRGSVHGLIGPNGAGKSTCFNLLTKFLAPTSGSIRYNGADITTLPPADVARRGLVRSFQISAVFPSLSLIENVRLALQRKSHSPFDFWHSERDLDRHLDRIMQLLGDVGLADLAHLPAGQLSYGRKRALEIATTLALDPETMLLDEPMAGMTDVDVEQIVTLIRRASQERTILIVEHNLGVIEGLCDTVTVLARGQVLAEGDYQTISADPHVIAAYIGIEVGEHD